MRSFLSPKKIIFLVLLLVVIGVSGIGMAQTLFGTVTELMVTPDPIRLGSTAYIQYTLSQDGYTSIKVYKDTGELVRTVLTNVLKIAGSYSQAWDGKDQNGILAPDGNYKIVVEARDANNALTGQADHLLTAARYPGISLVTDSPDPFNPLTGQQAAIDYTISSDSKVTVTILKGFTPVRTLATDVMQPAGAYRVTWDGKDDFGNIAGDAAYTYQINAVSPLVPGFSASFKSTTTLDSGPPAITDFTVSPDPFKIDGPPLSIRYNLSKNANITAKITDNAGNVVQTLLTNAAKTAGINSVTWDGKNSTGTYVAEGVYSAVITAVDNYGKSSGDQTRTFTAGYVPAIATPAISPNPFNPNNPVNNQAAISFSVSSDALVTVEILYGFLPVRTITSAQRTTAGNQVVKWDGRDDAGNPAGDGNYSYQITAVSPTVATFKSTYKNSVLLDTGAPGITGLTMTPDPFRLGSVTPLNVSCNLSENATVSIDIYDAKNAPVRALVINQPKNAGTNSAVWDGKDNFGNNVSEGIYTVVVSAVDSLNQRGEARGTVTAGYQPAISNATSTPEPFNPPVNGNVAINFDLSSNANVTVTILKGFAPVRTIAAGIPKNLGPNSFLWDGKDDSNLPVPDGSYTYQIEAVSPGVPSLSSTFKGSITVEASNPALTELSVIPAVVKVGSSTTLRYTLSEPATVSVQIYDAQSQPVRAFPAENKSAGTYSLVWDTKNNAADLITNGNYILSVNAVDKFNKTGFAELAFQAGNVPAVTNVTAVPDSIDVSAGQGTTISYSLTERSYVTVKLYDSANLLWRTIYHSKDVTGSDAVYWDGTSDKGLAAVGTFVYKIDATSVFAGIKALQVSGQVFVSKATNAQPTSTCTSCHKNYPAPHRMTNCFGCHGGNKPVQDCASCHPNWGSHNDGTVLNKYQCEYCHTSAYSAKIPNHPADIDAAHNTTTSLANCQPCHEPPLTKEHAKRVNPVTQTNYDCYTCHQSTVTEVVYAIKNKLTNCDACHKTISHDHRVTNYETAPDVKCVNCHGTGTATDPVTNAVYRTTELNAVHTKYNKTCSTCHATPFLGNVIANDGNIDMLMNSITPVYCSTCHNGNTAAGYPITREVKHAPEHKAVINENVKCGTCHDGITVNSTITGAVYNSAYAFTGIHAAGCNSCHDNTKVEAVIKAKVGLINNTYTCAECHDSAKAKTHNKLHTVKAYLNGSTDNSCASCHSNGDVVAVHSGITAAGKVLNCDTCHGATPVLPNTATVIKANLSTNAARAGYTCQDCHNDMTGGHNHNVTATGYAAVPDVDCGICHATGAAGTAELTAVHKNAAAAGKIANYGCATCHNSNFIGTVIGDGKLDMLSNGTSIYCANCHNGVKADNPGIKYPAHNGSHINSTGYGIYQGTYNGAAFDDSAADCGRCHTSLNTKVIHDPAVHLNVTCNSCHLSASTAVQQVVYGAWSRAATKAAYTCSTCHNTLPYLHKAEHVATSADAVSLECATCHSAASWTVNKAQVVGIHTNNCNTCHASANSVVSSFITGKQGLVNPVYNCEGCHTANGAKTKEAAHQPEHLAKHSVTNMTCSNCHTFSAAAGTAQDIKSATVHPKGCNTCHSSATRSDVKLFVNSKLRLNNPVYSCEDCHGVIHAGWESKHTGPALPATPWVCSKCHTNALHIEHSSSALLKQNAYMTCDSCHKSTLAKVTAAIKSIVTDGSNRKCDACHTGTTDGRPKVHSDITAPHLKGIFPTATDADCLKCHTAQAAEFVSTKASYHVANGLTAKTSGLGQYLSPYTATSNVGCQGCHGSIVAGGTTANANILKRPYTYLSTSADSNMLCYLCHDYNTYGGSTTYKNTGFRINSSNYMNLHNISDHKDNNGRIQCSWCHTNVPHATDKAHLVVTKTDPNSAGNLLTGFTHPASGQYKTSDCSSSSSLCSSAH